MNIPRPFPPNFLLESINPAFHPDGDLFEFAKRMFIDEDSEFYNEDHSHLALANIGFLWTNVPNERQMKQIAATAQIPNIQSSKWNKGIFDFQMANWFGDEPLNFLITIDGNYAQFIKGFTREGIPKFTMRDHDVTEFLGITRRYGPEVSLNVPEMIEAAKQKPLFSSAKVSAVCGNCMGLRP